MDVVVYILLLVIIYTRRTMCGIWCCISEGESDSLPDCGCDYVPEEFQNQRKFISRRGPDVSNFKCSTLEPGRVLRGKEHSGKFEETKDLRIHLESHVLWTQGKEPCEQPFSSVDGMKLMVYNGDIYSFQDAAGNGSPEYDSSFAKDNDGLTLFKLLENVSDREEGFRKVFTDLKGPYAFIFLDKGSKRLWFGRDFFGRESLLFSYNESNPLSNRLKSNIFSWNISSVSVYQNIWEVPATGLFCLNLQTKILQIFPYSHNRIDVAQLETGFITALETSGFISKAETMFQIALPFSCSLKLPENEDSAKNSSTLSSLIREAAGNGCDGASSTEFLKRSLVHLEFYIESFLSCLRKSVKRRVSTLPPYCKNCLLSFKEGTVKVVCKHAKVGVLFSGGLDSTVLAYLAAEVLPEGSTLDLINVAFSKDTNFTNIPDRETALASHEMLKNRFSPDGKTINLVLVNVSKPEVVEERSKRIKYLISPLKSVLDDSLGVCLWFAARGKGILHTEKGIMPEDYTSPIRVVLLGSGADELLGGYGRHRSAFEKSGWMGLGSEMQLEIDRISIRNLGRDNRIVSDLGVCPRMPFLDEDVVDFLTSHCDLWVKCCPANVGPLGSRGSGEKLLLRAVGAKLFGDGYLSLALFPKRAMQFGSRIAKLENSKEKGGDSCQRLD